MPDRQAPGKLARLKQWMKERLHVKTVSDKLDDKRAEIEGAMAKLAHGSAEQARLRQGLIDLKKLSERPKEALDLANRLLKRESKGSGGGEQSVAPAKDSVAMLLASDQGPAKFDKVHTFGQGRNGVTEMLESGNHKIVLKRAHAGGIFAASEAYQESGNYALLDANDRPGRELFLKSYGIVKVLAPDSDVHPDPDAVPDLEEREGLALEYVEGETANKFATTMKAALNEGKITQAEYWGVMQYLAAEMLRAVRYLDEIGVMHADLKPDNICIASDGRVKVLDLGSLTESVTGVKVPITHVSPEFLGSGDVREKAKLDTYMVGGTVYEMSERGAFNLKSARDESGMRGDMVGREGLIDQAQRYAESGEPAIDITPGRDGLDAVDARKQRISTAIELIRANLARSDEPVRQEGEVAKLAAAAAQRRRLEWTEIGKLLTDRTVAWRKLLADPEISPDDTTRLMREREIDALVRKVHDRLGSLGDAGTRGQANATGSAAFPEKLEDQEIEYEKRLAVVRAVLEQFQQALGDVTQRRNQPENKDAFPVSSNVELERIQENIDGVRAMIDRAVQFATQGRYHEATSLLYEAEARYAERTKDNGGNGSPRPGEQGVATAYTRFLDQLLAADPSGRLGADEGVPTVSTTSGLEFVMRAPGERTEAKPLAVSAVSAIETVEETGPDFIKPSQRLLSDEGAREVLARLSKGKRPAPEPGARTNPTDDAPATRQRLAAAKVGEILHLLKTSTSLIEKTQEAAIDTAGEKYKQDYKRAITALRVAQAALKPGGDIEQVQAASDEVREIVSGWWSRISVVGLKSAYTQVRGSLHDRLAELTKAIEPQKQWLGQLIRIPAAKDEVQAVLAYAADVAALESALDACDSAMTDLPADGPSKAKVAMDSQAALEALAARISLAEAKRTEFLQAARDLLAQYQGIDPTGRASNVHSPGAVASPYGLTPKTDGDSIDQSPGAVASPYGLTPKTEDDSIDQSPGSTANPDVRTTTTNDDSNDRAPGPTANPYGRFPRSTANPYGRAPGKTGAPQSESPAATANPYGRLPQ